ncbi:hypothetical protein EC973_006574 [Apophysomyces ossiformis]|uniref:Uncharacterized protein n=1 Tax=Apophysomyces ossiformis TaxID=679940 RepID=A0A8H7EUJ1_9FUNG|nr:hypothetical protein EC973_006574 [Apophysomyces ossiformis]
MSPPALPLSLDHENVYSLSTTGHFMPSYRRNSGSSSIIITTAPSKPTLTHHKLTLNSSFPTRTKPLFSKNDRKWRWWHFLSFTILVLGLLQIMALITGLSWLHERSTIRIALRQYPSMIYQHLDTTVPVSLEKETTIYHVTKEFGPAIFGGMGVTITALAAAQQRTDLTRVSIVMPHYSFLRNKYPMDRVVDLVINVRDKRGRLMPLEFRVSKMMYAFNDTENLATANRTTESSRRYDMTEAVPVYLIGPGNRSPLNQAFRARNAMGIYSSPKGLPYEWRDQYFVKAATAFLAHQATATDEESLFAPLHLAPPGVDIVHLHGATNAYIAKLLQDRRDADALGPKPPAIVYTMHDHMDEPQYTNSLGNVQKFLDTEMAGGSHYVLGHRMFMSSVAIDHADAVTLAGRTMASDIVEGRSDFYLKEVVMGSILRKASQRRFFGISNGIDLTSMSPFTDIRLSNRKIAFPDHAYNILSQQTLPAAWGLTTNTTDYISTAKDRAKKYLMRRNLLSEADLKRPLVLYVGPFDHSKGLDRFEEASALFEKYNMKFIILGQPGSYPLQSLQQLQSKYPDNVLLLFTPQHQRQYTIFCRAAADFVFVPSKEENFGLAAAEGLLFGSAVISTGVGGLSEFLVDRPFLPEYSSQNETVNPQMHTIGIRRDKQTRAPTVTSQEKYNAYLFTNQLEEAVRDASIDFQWYGRIKALREEYHLRMIRTALDLAWDRESGPVHDYMRVYQVAQQYRPIPHLTRHDVEEEKARRLRLLRAA